MTRKDYDDLKDEHVGHTKENPSSLCFMCRQKGWIEEDKKQEEEEEEENTEKQSKKLKHADEASGYEKQGLKEARKRIPGR